MVTNSAANLSQADPVTVLASTRDATLDALRGLAALAVAWYHFVVCSPVADRFPGLQGISELGRHGVEVFFVLSGFVIPLSMAAGGYEHGSFGRFMAKRFLRVHPPYVASLLLVAGLAWAAGFVPGHGGERFAVRPIVWLQHLTFTTDFHRNDWLLPVYWTLAIELQFYLLVGCAFPLLTDRRAARRNAAMLVLALAPVLLTAFTPPGAWHRPWFPWWSAAFVPGIAAFQHRRGLIAGRAQVAWTAAGAAGMWVGHGPAYGPGAAAACVLATAAILYVRLRWRPLVWLGIVSYSFYLVHVPIGGRLLGIGGRHLHGQAAGLALVLVAFAASVAVAWAMRRWVEERAAAWAKHIRYRRRPAGGGGTPAREPEPSLVAAAAP